MAALAEMVKQHYQEQNSTNLWWFRIRESAAFGRKNSFEGSQHNFLECVVFFFRPLRPEIWNFGGSPPGGMGVYNCWVKNPS